MKKTKNLTEELELQLAMPVAADSVVRDNMISVWEGVSFPELSVILTQLRYAFFVHQTHHWTAKGDSFYGDHLLFQRLYDGVALEIDAVAEKAIGLSGEGNVNLVLQISEIQKLAANYGVAMSLPLPTDLAKKSLAVELDFIACLEHCTQSMKEKNTLTNGLDNLLAGIADKHEGHVYLLKQRCQ